MANTYKIKTKKIPRINYSNIIKDDDLILRETSKDVAFPLDKKNKLIMNQMIDYVRSSQDDEEAQERDLMPAVGISAIQLGFIKKMIYVRVPASYSDSYEEFALVNPRIVELSEKKCYLNTGESCLSVEKIVKGYVYRSYQITLTAMDHFNTQEVQIEAKGYTAIVLQHELDHLMGILYYDRIKKEDPFYVDKDAIKINV